ncbi:hypothetical protein HK096_006598, partial [Nowakowskiella sp. JEL0078]
MDNSNPQPPTHNDTLDFGTNPQHSPLTAATQQRNATDSSLQLAQLKDLVMLQRQALHLLASKLDHYQRGELEKLALLLKHWDLRYPLASSADSPTKSLSLSSDKCSHLVSQLSLDRQNSRFQLDPLGPISSSQPTSALSISNNESLLPLADLFREQVKPVLPPLSTNSSEASFKNDHGVGSKTKRLSASAPAHHHNKHHVNLVPLAGDGGSLRRIKIDVLGDRDVEAVESLNPVGNPESRLSSKTSGNDLR